MYCIKCWNYNTKVTDSRLSCDWKVIRRRRECENCLNRFTTFEKVELVDLIVEKSWNRRERYNREKLEDSILKACNKINISVSKIDNIIVNLESKRIWKEEINSKEIWNLVLEELKTVNDVAYIRYASVHHRFETARDFMEFIKKDR